MRRRDFIIFVGGAAAAWPRTTFAQQTGKLPTIGVLGTNSTVWRSWIAAFADRLHELGWADGQNIAIQYRWSEGQPERVSEIAAEFVRLKTDVIVAVSGAIPTVRRVTTTIPIIFPISVDPIGTGLIANLSRPSGNVTGLSIQSTDVAGKRLGFLREIVPHLRRLAIIFHGNSVAVVENDAVQAAAHTLGLEVAPREIRRAEDIAPAFAAFKGQADALYVVEDSLVSANSEQIVGLTLNDRLPTAFYNRDVVSAGGLFSYGPSFPALFRRAADFVDKILRGTKPGDIPVEQPTKFEFVINLTTARALGLTIPASMLSLADELVE